MTAGEARRACERIYLALSRLELGYRSRGGDLRPASSPVCRHPQLRVEGVPVEGIGEAQLRHMTRVDRRARDSGELGTAVGRANDCVTGTRTGQTPRGPEHPPLLEADRGERGGLEVCRHHATGRADSSHWSGRGSWARGRRDRTRGARVVLTVASCSRDWSRTGAAAAAAREKRRRRRGRPSPRGRSFGVGRRCVVWCPVRSPCWLEHFRRAQRHSVPHP